MPRRACAILSVLMLWCGVAWGQSALPAPRPILAGPLAKLDVKAANFEAVRGKPSGSLNIGLHFGIDPGWFDPLGYYGPALHFYYLMHDALIKPMPQGEFTYSLAEHAEMTADFTKAAFRLRPGLKFQDGHPFTTADVKWTYENYRGYNFKLFQDKLDRIEIVDDRTIVFHFKGPFVDFLDLYNGAGSGAGWVVPKYYEPSSPFHNERVRQAVSLAINRQFLVKQETQRIGKPWGNWISHEIRDALRGDGTDLPVPPYDPARAKQLLAEAGYPNGFDVDWYVPLPLYLNPFVHAVGPRVLPEGEAVHRYWHTLNAPFPWPWEVWEVKG